MEEYLHRRALTQVIGTVDLTERPETKFFLDENIKVTEQFSLFRGECDNQPITVKRIAKQSGRAFLNEEYLLKRLAHHENVIRFLFKVDDPQYFYIITDDHQITLEQYVNTNRVAKMVGAQGLSFIATKDILKQLADAVEFLHGSNILKLNINPRNASIVSQNNGIVKIKMTNFDVAKEMVTTCSVEVPNLSGMEGFVAPEVRRKQQANFSADIYSLGCLYFYAVSAGDLLPQDQEIKLIWKIMKVLLKHKTSDAVLGVNLMKRMLNFNASKRQSIDNVIKHPYFWKTHEIFDLILEAVKISEDENRRQEFQAKLEINQGQVIGENWLEKVDEIVRAEIGKRGRYEGVSLLHLVKVIRNHFAHRISPILAEVMGTDQEGLKNYWLGKFPNLIPHLYRVMK